MSFLPLLFVIVRPPPLLSQPLDASFDMESTLPDEEMVEDKRFDGDFKNMKVGKNKQVSPFNVPTQRKFVIEIINC